MYPVLFAIILTASLGLDGPAQSDASQLIDTIESLQELVDDFRCEFEGTIRFKGKSAEGVKLGEDGLHESFSGTFIWKRGGDTCSEILKRRARIRNQPNRARESWSCG